MPKLTYTASIEADVITEAHKAALCFILLTQIMGKERVQKLSQQGKNQENSGTEEKQRSISYS